MLWLALKALFHEKARLALTLLGIAVSAVLALVEIAIYLGMMGNATAVIRHSAGDIWVASRGIQSFDFALPFPQERLYAVRALPEVAWAEKIIINYGFIKLPNGGREQVQYIGFNPDTGVGGPWAMRQGSAGDVKGGRYMIIDKTSEQRLGALAVGSLWEVTLSREHSYRLVGLSYGIRSFTTIPIVFLSYHEAERLLDEAGWPGQTSYIVAKLKQRADGERVVAALRQRMKDNEVFTREEFVHRTVRYWTIQTGMGMAFFLTALLAVVIGGAIVGQTIYASTVQYLREYGTLKALGAENADIYLVIQAQAALGAIGGYGIAAALVLLLRAGIEGAGVPLYLSPTLFAAVFGVFLAACLASAWFAVSKIRSLDPVTVFKA
jgi:putative ABC transport system permease protein